MVQAKWPLSLARSSAHMICAVFSESEARTVAAWVGEHGSRWYIAKRLLTVQVLFARRTSTNVFVIRVNMADRVKIEWTDTPASVCPDTLVKFSVAVAYSMSQFQIIILFHLQVLDVRRTLTNVIVTRVNKVKRVWVRWVDLPVTVHLDSPVNFLPRYTCKIIRSN